MERIIEKSITNFLTKEFNYNTNKLLLTYEHIDFSKLLNIKKLIYNIISIAGFKILDNSDCLPIYEIEYINNQFIFKSNIDKFLLDLRCRYIEFICYQINWCVDISKNNLGKKIEIKNWLGFSEENSYFLLQMNYFIKEYGKNLIYRNLFYDLFNIHDNRILFIEYKNNKPYAYL